MGSTKRTGTGLRALGLAWAMVLAGAACAQDSAANADEGFQAYLATLRQQALGAGVSRATADAVFPTLTLNPRVVALDRQQPGSDVSGPASRFAPYRIAHVDAARIGRGQRAYDGERTVLRAIERASGVPGPIMVAIWGHETDYGANRGNFDLLRSLASLAYDGRRRPLFAGEFVAGLKMIDRGVSRDQLKGSWAGATGNPQFLPSVYLRVARDGDGDGRIDIWNSAADTLASIGNYFADAGWRAGEPWGVAVSVPEGFDRSRVVNRMISPRCPRVFARASGWRTMAEWRALGVVSSSGLWSADRVMATLIEPDGPDAAAYLVTGNYRVILDYNCSNFYALSVGLLADAIAR